MAIKRMAVPFRELGRLQEEKFGNKQKLGIQVLF